MTSASPAGPLAGIKIVELAGIGPGPFAAMLLADMGADVVRIERPSGSTSAVPEEKDALRRGRSNIAIDLRDPRGVEAVLQLVETADVLIEGYRPGVTERMGLGPEDVWARNPKLVYGRMTGWGQEGPLSATAGHDIGYIAITGALHAMGRKGEKPAIPLNLVGDFGGGSLYLAMGILAAVIEAGRSGRGQVVDAAIVDGAASLLTLQHGLLHNKLWRDERGVNMLDGGLPWYEVYETSDGKYMAVGALEPQFFQVLVDTLGIDYTLEQRNDPSTWPALTEQLTAAFASKTRDEWADIFAPTDACVAPVLSLAEAKDHPHLAARGTYTELEGVNQPAPAPRFSRTPAAIGKAPGPVGADTVETLTRWGVKDVETLVAEGVAKQAP